MVRAEHNHPDFSGYATIPTTGYPAWSTAIPRVLVLGHLCNK